MNETDFQNQDNVPDESLDAANTEEESPMADTPSLEVQLQNALNERDANYDQLIRTQAEFDNFRKRTQKEFEQFRQYQALPLAKDLLPGLDNLQRAVNAAESTANIGDLIEGVQMVLKQFEDVLAGHSAKPIESVGRPFDPNLHEALQQVPSAEYPAMTVVDEVERGYTIHDRVVRPSKVIVSSGPPAQTPTDA